MSLIETIHRPDGMPSTSPDYVRRTMTPDPDAFIPCMWEYTLPSGKAGTCGAMATWELVYDTTIPQPFGATGNIHIHDYRCTRHHQEEQ